MQIGLFKTDGRKAGNALLEGHRQLRQSSGMAVNRIGFEVVRIDLFKPRIFVRGKHAVGLAGQRQDLGTLENHMVFEGVKSRALRLKQRLDFRIASQRLGFVVVVGKYRVDF